MSESYVNTSRIIGAVGRPLLFSDRTETGRAYVVPGIKLERVQFISTLNLPNGHAEKRKSDYRPQWSYYQIETLQHQSVLCMGSKIITIYCSEKRTKIYREIIISDRVNYVYNVGIFLYKPMPITVLYCPCHPLPTVIVFYDTILLIDYMEE